MLIMIAEGVSYRDIGKQSVRLAQHRQESRTQRRGEVPVALTFGGLARTGVLASVTDYLCTRACYTCICRSSDVGSQRVSTQSQVLFAICAEGPRFVARFRQRGLRGKQRP